ncbi:MAG: SpoIIE family protein phosphatase [Spirochaetes bacterium]|nr:SpoIIE family protein phosphatase [Spirochaetota bacterium]
MKIKYKLIIIFIIIIIAATLPLSLYILETESREKISMQKDQGFINSRILSGAVLNIVLMNGGSIKASRVDSYEMISVLKPLTEAGLIYADAILFSSKKKYNGLILAHISSDSFGKKTNNSWKLPDDDIKRLSAQANITEYFMPELNETVFEIISTSSIPGKNTYCMGRLIFSKAAVLAPLDKIRNLILLAAVATIIVTIIISLILGRTISAPIESLIKEVEIIGSGDLDYRIEIRGIKEINKLANTFNHLAQVLKLEIDHLRNKNVELIRINSLKDDFLANVTHELRTPLYGMIGLAESLMAGVAGELEQRARHNLSLMINSGKRLSSLVSDILDYSQLKHEDIALKFASVNLHSIVRLIISITSSLLENKPIEIRTSIEPESYYVLSDENRLQQILINIIGNAIKFTESGTIDIGAEESDKNPDEIIVSVKDTGIGIREEDQGRIFELFEQAEGSITKYKTGTGIGLSITKQLIELHGGSIWVDSEPGKGSCFYFTLKKSNKSQVILDAGPNKKIPETVQKEIAYVFDERIIPEFTDPENKLAYSKIMIVDDEPVNAQILINYLYLEGYILIPVASGQDALGRIESGDVPDLLILDVMLPIMSGYDVCRKVREKYTAGELPILILTAKSSPADLIIGFEAGTNDYLTKPVSKAELLARVNGLLQLKKSVKDQTTLNLIRQEINIAQRIQTNLLRNKMPDINELSLAIRYYPMYEIGGDFYEIVSIDESRVGVFLADVSGHGIPAAFISAMLKVICTANVTSAEDPAKFLEKINESIYSLIEDQFITACYSVIDIKRKKIIHSNAGHWPMIICRRGDELIIKKGVDMPFGCIPDENYTNIEFDLYDGDRLVFYTDGIIEIRNADKKMFGSENLYRVIKENAGNGIELFADNVIDSIMKWYNTNETIFADDVTLLVLDVNGLGTDVAG